VNARLLARAIGAGRIGFGVALLVAPKRVAGPWLGSDARRAGTQVSTRALGARDLVLGAGALASGESELRAWVAAAALADLADFLATVTAGDALPARGRLMVGALAAGSAALGAAAATQLG
jgi:hypothetical protein